MLGPALVLPGPMLRQAIADSSRDAGAPLVDAHPWILQVCSGRVRGGTPIRHPGPEICRGSMLHSLLSLALVSGIPGEQLPPMATMADQAFAFGSIVFLVGLILWHHRSDSDPPKR